MFCPNCGTELTSDAAFCSKCGKSLKESSPGPTMPSKPVGGADSGFQTLIPYKNAYALIAYYCGVFAILPCFPIGLVGLVLGIMGLKHAKKYPESKGKIHAWIGIIFGGLFGILYTVLSVLMLMGIFYSKSVGR